MLLRANRKTYSPVPAAPHLSRSWNRQAILWALLAGACLPSALPGQTWTQQSPSASPPARTSAAMVYDSVNHQTVLFGGEDFSGTPLNDTWVYDGSNWTKKSPATSPPARLSAGMAFDAEHGQAVLFGGTPTAGPNLTYLNDTWLWNGANGTWTNANPATSPSGRQAPAMAYGAPVGSPLVYLFGGSSHVGTALQDTWGWNGTDWFNQSPATSATPRRFASMSFDPVNLVMVLFGGDNGVTDMNDTWVFDEEGWTQLNPAHSPSARDGQGQAWDTVRNLTVIFGGSNTTDTWTWNGTDWTQESTPNSPSARFGFTMAYDIQHSDMVLFGGELAALTSDLNDTWTLGYSYTESWMMVSNNTTGPAGLVNASAVSAAGGVALFGGSNGTSVVNDTWIWTGNEWSLEVGVTPPSARQSAAMAADSSGGALLFGGNSSVSGTALLNDTWIFYDNGLWSQAAVANPPPARDGSAMVYDGTNQNIVLFGGFTGSYANDTWTWNGSSWAARSPAAAPSGRALHSMVYDGARGQVVLFGGIANGTLLNDTWIWDGNLWTKKTPAASPPARDNFSMVYDSVHGKVQIFGGLGATGALKDTWQWDGVNWTQVSPAATPESRYGAASAYLPAQGQFFIADGTSGAANFADGWIFASPSVTTTTLPLGYAQQAYSQTITPSGGIGPYTFTVDGAPNTFATLGLALNGATGAITGTDNVVPGQHPIQIGVTIHDAQGQSTDFVFFLPTDASIFFSPGPLPDATMGANYSYTLTASGGTAPFTFQVTGLPGGMSTSGNQITGQCTASSTGVMITAIDSLGGTASAGPLTLNCNPAPLITNTSPLPAGNTSGFYSVSLTTNAVYDPPGAAPFIWSVPPNTLPPGLTLDSSGNIFGVPSTPGTYTFTVTFTDRWGATTSKQLKIAITLAFQATTAQLPFGTLNVAYPPNTFLAVSGGVSPYTFSATTLPPGLSIDLNTGAITGTPTQAGTFSTVFSVTDSVPETLQTFIPITVAAAGTNSENWTQLLPSFSPGDRRSASMFYDSVHNRTILFGGSSEANPPVDNDTESWDGANWTTVTPANGPSGRSNAAAAFDAAHGKGVLFGGQDQNGVALADTWLWDGSTWTQVTPANSPSARFQAVMAYDGHQIVLFGGNPNNANDVNDTWIWNGTTWTQIAAAVSGTPPGVRQNAAMAYDSTHGKVVMFGGFNNISNTDYADTWLWDGGALTWTQVNPAASPAARDAHTMAYDTAHSQVVLFGGFEESSFSAQSDTWSWNGSTWTQLNTLDSPASRSSQAMVYDAARAQVVLFGGDVPEEEGTDSETWVFGGPAVSSLSLPNATEGSLYSASITVAGGTSPYLFVAPTLPQGITFNSTTGVFGGTPTVSGPFSVAVTIQDSNGLSIAPQFSLNIISPLSQLTLQPGTLPDATAGANYSEQLSASGGLTPYTFSATGLPAGLTVNANNQIVGQCTAGSNNVMLKVIDSVPETAIVGPLTVNCNAFPSITTAAALANGIVNTPYSATLQSSGGTAPILWSLSPGSTLPGGFNLSASGVLTGTATTAVSSQFTAKVGDFWGATVSRQFTVNFYPVLTISTTTLPNGTAGTAYPAGVVLAVIGGTGSGTYAFSATGLPTGYSIDGASGTISGATTQTGPFTPTFVVTDQTPQTVSKQLNLTISPASGLSFTSPQLLPSGAHGQPYSYQLLWTGGVSPFTLTGTGLPGWLQLNSTSGLLTGTPPAGGAFAFSIKIADSQQPTANTASQSFTIVVDPPTVTTASPLPAALIGIAYSQNLAASGGTGPYQWTSSNLPAWLNLSTGGVLTGTPPVGTPASVSFNVTVTDSLGAFVAGGLTLPVQATPGLGFTTSSPLSAATVGALYSTTMQAMGGNGVFTFSSSGLPGWLTLNTSTGQLSGTPPSAGPVTFQITVADNVNQSLSQMFTLPVDAALTFGTTTPLPPATVGGAYAETLTASGGSGSYTWSATGLPSWLTLSAGGVFSGTPTQSGSISLQITVKDTLSNSISQSFTLPVDATLTINTASPLLAATAGFLYTATFGASGGGGGYQWTATGLPNGFNLTTAGVLTGTPAAATPISFSVKVSDSINNSLSQNFTLPVNATVTINTTSPLLPATVLIPYTANFTASGGNPGYSWAATGLPSWLTLTAAGFLTGTPPTGATALSFPVTVTDMASHSVTVTFNLPVNASLVINTAVLPVATVNVGYSTALAATGGSGIYTWSATGLPGTLSLSPAGVLSGAVPQAGPYSFPVKVTDSDRVTSSASLTLLVSTGFPLSFVTQSLAPCVAGVNCSSQLTAAGGVPPYVFSVPGGTNLYGLTLTASGFLNGVPTTGGQIRIPVTLTDQQGSIAAIFTQSVESALTVNAASLPPGVVGAAYLIQVGSGGGQQPYVWSVAGGSLPPGLALNPPGGNVISGVPTAAGTYVFSLQVADGLQTSPPQPMSIAIAAPAVPLSIVSAAQLPAGMVGTAYSQNLTAAGGSGQYTWTLTGGSLPAGLTLAASGAITGAPATAQTGNFTAKVNDTAGNSVSAGFSLVVTNPATVALLTANPLPNGIVGVPYNYGIQVTGGTPPYFWSITQGQVPAGVTFDATNGTFSGTPTTPGSFVFVLTLTDSGGTPAGGLPSAAVKHASVGPTSATGNYTIRIAGVNDFQITTAQTLPNGAMGQSYSTTLAASGGAAPYKWQLVNGTLPAGLTLSTGGVLAGTPSTAGAAALLIQATDTTGAVATASFLLRIANPNVPAINATPAPPAGLVSVPYQAGFSALGGKLPYTWSIGAGSLPPGLSLNPQSGALGGTPSQAGNFPFTVQVTDSARVSATQAFTIRVNTATLQIAPSPAIPNATLNVPYVFGLSVTGGTAPYTWSLSAGSLPGGFSIDSSSGVLSGTAATTGVYPFTVSVADAKFGVASQQYQLTVQSNALTITTSSLPPATVGAAYIFGLQEANGAPPWTWSVASGSPPPGIQLASDSGMLAGTPTSAGSFAFTVQVTDGTTATARANFTLVVNPPPLNIVTTVLPGGAAGAAYSQTLQAKGGTGAIAWSIAAGTLPPGLSLAGATGAITGTPTTPGAFPFTAQAKDSTGVLAVQALTLNIAAPALAPAITLSGLPVSSKPGDQPVVTINLAGPYSLPILVTATLSITPNPGNATDLMFSNGSRSIQFTIPANTTQATLPFQTGTLPGTIQLSLTLSAAGSNVTPSPGPVLTTTIPAAAPVIQSVTAALISGGFQVAVVGTSTTLDMKTATFQFTPAAGATLQTTTVTIDVSSQFAAWYQSSASLATGSQFSLTMPFTVSGNVSSIASVAVTLTNSAGASAAASAIIP